MSIKNLLSSETAAPRACLGKLKLEFQEIISMKVAESYLKSSIKFLLLYLLTSPCAAMFHCKHPGGPRIIIHQINYEHKQLMSN